MADNWQTLLATPPPPLSFPEHRNVTPLVLDPQCPQHCSGRHEVEANLVCGACRGVPYRLVAHGRREDPAHLFYSYEPANGAAPLASSERPVCPRCRGELRRAWR